MKSITFGFLMSCVHLGYGDFSYYKATVVMILNSVRILQVETEKFHEETAGLNCDAFI